MKTQLDMDKIAKGLGAERRGKVTASAGYFGAAQLLADIEARFRVPVSGGRPTDPSWTERRLLPLTPKTLKKLEELSAKVREHGTNVEPMQLAALLLEKSAAQLNVSVIAKMEGTEIEKMEVRLGTAQNGSSLFSASSRTSRAVSL